MSNQNRQPKGAQVAGVAAGGQFKASEHTAPAAPPSPSSMLTPQQLADRQMSAFSFIGIDDFEDGDERDSADIAEQSYGYIRDQIAEAIEADRAQRDIYALIAEALEDRASDGIHLEDEEGSARARRAAAAVRGEGDYQDPMWDMWIGPMLDQLERVYGE